MYSPKGKTLLYFLQTVWFITRLEYNNIIIILLKEMKQSWNTNYNFVLLGFLLYRKTENFSNFSGHSSKFITISELDEKDSCERELVR